ncbi:hypothetical protein EON79_05305 [bacterium]|nr:MAG: hypothetical protein EON79_05305 [bacterium]
MVSGWGRSRSTVDGPVTSFSVHTTFCIESSGVIHGPPLPHHPASSFMFTWRPRRAASFTAKANNRRHSGLANATGPVGVPWAVSMMSTPPIPVRFIASRSAVMPPSVMLPSSQNQ